MSYVVFLDLDHTILNINSGAALLGRAYKNGVLSFGKLIYAYYLGLAHKLKILDSGIIIKKLAGWLANYSVSDIESLCLEILEKDLIPAIRPQITEEIKSHKEKKAKLVILSSAITSICSPIAKYLAMDAVICSELEVKNQLYTGLASGRFCLREEKLNRMKQYLQTNNFSMEEAWYYGDSIDDLPVLRAVGYPVCVSPQKKLEKIARKENWVIHAWD